MIQPLQGTNLPATYGAGKEVMLLTVPCCPLQPRSLGEAGWTFISSTCLFLLKVCLRFPLFPVSLELCHFEYRLRSRGAFRCTWQSCRPTPSLTPALERTVSREPSSRKMRSGQTHLCPCRFSPPGPSPCRAWRRLPATRATWGISLASSVS